MLQTTITCHHSRLRGLLVLGKNKKLCETIKVVWQEMALLYEPDNQCCCQPETVVKTGNFSAAPASMIASGDTKLTAAYSHSEARNLLTPNSEIILFPDVEASLLVLSSNLNVWVHLEPVNDTSLSESGLPMLPSATASLWRVVFVSQPQLIAELLHTEAVRTALPHCSHLQACELSNNDSMLRRLCLQLVKIASMADGDVALSDELDPRPEMNVSTNNTASLHLSKIRAGSEPEKSTVQPSNLMLLPMLNSLPLEYLQNVFGEAPIGIIYESLDGGILNANPAFCRWLGYTETQLRHLDRRYICHPEDFAAELRLIQQMCNGGAKQIKFRKRYLRRDGSFFAAEVCLSLIGDEAEDSYLLSFITDLSEREVAETQIQQRNRREKFLSEVASICRSKNDLNEVLRKTGERLRLMLETDRILVLQLVSGGEFISKKTGMCCVAEDVNPLYPGLNGQCFSDNCIPPPYLNAYRFGRLWVGNDIQSADISDCHRHLLEEMHVRSMMVVGIVSNSSSDVLNERGGGDAYKPLWGLLVVHHCQTPRRWTEEEQQLLQEVAIQISIAIEQTSQLSKLQAHTRHLEENISQRTQTLERLLKFEEFVQSLTQRLRNCFEETGVLKAALGGLSETLGVESCYGALLEIKANFFKIKYEWCGRENSCIDALSSWPVDAINRLSKGESLLIDRPGSSGKISELICPILDSDGLMGVICLCFGMNRPFLPEEIHWVEQVAAQCAVAIRRACLFQQEFSARQSAEYFRLFIEQSNDIFVEYDSLGRYLSINPAGAALLGYSISEIIGQTNNDLRIPDAPAIEELLSQVYSTAQKVVANHDFSLPCGEVRSFETVYAPILDAAGGVQRVIGIGRDVTEIRASWGLLQHQNQQLAEINRLKEEFIANTSHELRTPLTAILGFSSVLLEQSFGLLNPKQKLYIDRIHSSGQHLLDLINDILDLSRIEADRLELDLQVVFIEDICEGVTSLIQERVMAQGLGLELDVDPELEFMVTDPRRLKQMLLNLLVNATKFTPEGAVGLKIYRSRGANNCELINFMVWDTGIGIEPANQRRLFSPFSQIDSSLSRKYQGTGLGLVITRKLAELQGGSISVDSEAGKGSRFTISLPLNLAAGE
ncbi:PAS domain S-box protein [Ancylothrix sp. C2]|uniref:PAS domain S-box protein n=1 Tax=Ancylothrix sp. D3o TaxID=2953691 RepID=UPI0021BB9770|nr:PAS domain S-box protein [Ancylothrix sp. D3o]MCT7949305.1 PAS domain S-box protein [Ancylothrix sp. D3o]